MRGAGSHVSVAPPGALYQSPKGVLMSSVAQSCQDFPATLTINSAGGEKLKTKKLKLKLFDDIREMVEQFFHEAITHCL
jgi:hypothetical protein